ncbi:lipopolysaccharide assembly protein LapB [Gammaproteobacteria bacterium]|nr:lipopolysaccharide assembly protein LapB [Gammaproteobacteria bacterium]
MEVFCLLLVFFIIFMIWSSGYFSKLNYSLLPKDYLKGLNFLLNDESDKAVDIFINMLQVNTDTIETHFALGKLFRRKGEIDRAIRIHQNLINNKSLDQSFHFKSLYELGLDYLNAGMLDYAEEHLVELIDIKEYSVRVIKALLDIYQQEKAWESAIDMAYRLVLVTKVDMSHVIAHYYCELADINYINNKNDIADRYIKQAINEDEHCVRASLLYAKSCILKKEYKAALKSLKRIKEQNSDYLSEAIEPLALCYREIKDEKKLIEYLMEILLDHPNVPVVLILSERIREWRGDLKAAEFVADYVRKYPSVRGLNLFIKFHLKNTSDRVHEDLTILQNLTKKLLADKLDYQCVECGFASRSLDWYCPGCKQWSVIKPTYCLDTL